ncbi:MAG: hypothetical protein GQ540_03365 [Lutibacter sp.]|uniref:hypothetical protein n=1 Tax=Lutibacter sp. TaxID=1925666 RepID=UPI0019EFF8A0|nr:hypothetical protein [Lutibacter sp.]NOR27551.1 hypothetical protein [Lutibacter sp.]
MDLKEAFVELEYFVVSKGWSKEKEAFYLIKSQFELTEPKLAEPIHPDVLKNHGDPSEESPPSPTKRNK